MIGHQVRTEGTFRN